jgi:hypothetical protein
LTHFTNFTNVSPLTCFRKEIERRGKSGKEGGGGSRSLLNCNPEKHKKQDYRFKRQVEPLSPLVEYFLREKFKLHYLESIAT